MTKRRRIPPEIDRRVRETFGNRCCYCQARREYSNVRFRIDHIIPLKKKGTDNERNLCLACDICNGHKAAKTEVTDPITNTIVTLFHPRTDRWADHFVWADDGVTLLGLTPVGRATIEALCINSDEIAVQVRANWVAAGWHPPKE